jgi:peptide/nickel transport system substrate-binding protein
MRFDPPPNVHQKENQMKRPTRLFALAAAAAALLVAGVAATTATATHARTAAGDTLVVDKSFDLKTADPQRQYEPTGGIVDRALYDTLLKFKGADVAHPAPSVATGYKASKDARTYTFTLRKDVRFSDGSRLTSADVVFSYNRLVNLKGNPSFLLAGTTTTAKGPYTVVIRSKTPNPAIPVLVANTSLGIVNSKVVRSHGGSAAADADKADKAESFLNSQSAGSGPYILKSYSTTSQVVLTRNPRYWGKSKPKFANVVIRNVNSAAQLLNIQRGSNEVSLDLSADQAKGLNGGKVNIERTPSANVFFLFANSNPKVSATSSNAHIQNAIRLALDYQGYVRVAGSGAARAAGVIPSMFLGALKSSAIQRNLTKAKAEVKASGIASPKLKLEFPSDITSNGLSFGVLAQKVKSDLEAAGIDVELAGSPVATSLNTYRAGTEELGLWYWGPDYPDPNDYLVFLPGQTVGLRAGWAKGSYPALEKLGVQAGSTASPATRAKLFQQIGNQLNARSPFYPLVQPGQVVATSKNLTGTTFNVVYWIDVTAVGSR